MDHEERRQIFQNGYQERAREESANAFVGLLLGLAAGIVLRPAMIDAYHAIVTYIAN
jgi:hypothetical protein